MRQRDYGRDFELTFRMGFTMMMLAVVYVLFLGLLMFAGIPWEMVLIIAIAYGVLPVFPVGQAGACYNWGERGHCGGRTPAAWNNRAAGGDCGHAQAEEDSGHGDACAQRISLQGEIRRTRSSPSREG